MSDAENKRELLERSANRTRERLIETLSELDQRRHEITDVKGQVKKQVHEHAKPIALTGGGIILAVSTLVGVSVYRLATRQQRLRRERMKALRRFWMHPERLARKTPPKGTLASDIGRRVITSALTFVALELTKRSLRGALHTDRSQDANVLGGQQVVVRTLPA